MSGELKGKAVLIAGATGALGSAVVKEFINTNANLILVSRSEDKLETLVADTNLPSERVLLVPTDVTDPASVDILRNRTQERFGGVDVLLNTVGGWSGGKTVGDVSSEDWEKVLRFNLTSAFLISKAVLPGMLEAGWGRIIHIASKTATSPRAKQAAYAVSKAGVITLTEVIAAEVKGTGVTANVILPSIIDSTANRKMMPKAEFSKWVPPERIAATMRFLCSDAAASVNGASIQIYGAI